MNILKATALSLSALAAVGLYSAPAMSATITSVFQYGVPGQTGSSGIAGGNMSMNDNRHIDANAYDGNSNTFRSLGLGGAAVFSFTDGKSAFANSVKIWETSFNCGSATGYCNSNKESVKVYGANTWNGSSFNIDTNWIDLTAAGAIKNGDAQNGAIVSFTGAYKYLLFVDQRSGSGDGFDIAELKPNAVVPIPAAAWLFGSALLGLVGIARRRQSSPV